MLVGNTRACPAPIQLVGISPVVVFRNRTFRTGENRRPLMFTRKRLQQAERVGMELDRRRPLHRQVNIGAFIPGPPGR